MFMREKKRIEFSRGYNIGGKHIERKCMMGENKKRPPVSGTAAGLALWIAGGLIFLLVCRCRQYAFENRSLTAENRELASLLADRNAVIAKKTEEVESLQTQLAKLLISEEQETESGFLKKNGVYLIDTKEQLFVLRRMLREGEEAEPGVPAAEASYRLRNDMELGNDSWFCLGTEENPFRGAFDGDGHSIRGRFSLMDSVTPRAMFHMEESAVIENLELCNDLSPGEIRITVEDGLDCQELGSHLPGLPDCSVHVEVEEWGTDVEQAAKALRRHWEQGGGQDGYYVSMTFHPEMFEEDRKPAGAEQYMQEMQEALCSLAGKEYEEAIREAMAREDGCLWFVRLERIGELSCCTFEISEPAYEPVTHYYEKDHPDDTVYTDAGYYIAVSGALEKEKLASQCLRIPYTKMAMRSVGIRESYRVEGVDLNFDGKRDLLIHEGSSGGTGGNWGNYRAAVWKEDAGQFVYFPSLPEQITSLELDEERAVVQYQLGISYGVVEVYEVVKGAYVCTRKLVCEVAGDEITLSSYEMDELVETYSFSDWGEMEALRDERYPDLNYWPKG